MRLLSRRSFPLLLCRGLAAIPFAGSRERTLARGLAIPGIISIILYYAIITMMRSKWFNAIFVAGKVGSKSGSGRCSHASGITPAWEFPGFLIATYEQRNGLRDGGRRWRVPSNPHQEVRSKLKVIKNLMKGPSIKYRQDVPGMQRTVSERRARRGGPPARRRLATHLRTLTGLLPGSPPPPGITV